MALTTSDLLLALDDATERAITYSDWQELGSVDRALSYITAVRQLILLKPKAVGLGGSAGESFQNDLQSHLELMKRAELYVGKRRAITTTRMYDDFRHYRT